MGLHRTLRFLHVARLTPRRAHPTAYLSSVSPLLPKARRFGFERDG